MPATTAKGYPYPLGTDRVMDGDDSIHNLATAIDQRLGVAAAGIAPVAVASGANTGSLAVTFPAGRFNAVPVVMCTYVGTNVSWGMVNASSVTATGCTVTANHRDGQASGSNFTANVQWHATQLP